jgi:hypothetical protein
MHISLQNFFSQSIDRSGKSCTRNPVSGPFFTAVDAGKRWFRETVDAGKNNVIYMGLISGPKLANGEYRQP